MPEILPGLAPLADRYDAFLLDLWGVVHDGYHPFPGVVECLERLAARGQKVVILSNAPRRVAAAVERLERMGVPGDLYTGLMTSGEATWRILRDRATDWAVELGPRCRHVGPERDLGMLEIDWVEAVDSVDAADFVLCTGSFDDDDALAVYDPLLDRARVRALPMVCANPDYEVIHGGVRRICAGAIARRYEELGGTAHWTGKPLPRVYELCRALLDDLPAARVLAIGDSLRTDIAGAAAAGMDAVFVPGGIHGEALGVAHGEAPDPARLDALYRDYGQRPLAALTAFRW